jgi:hypothetical protein
MSGSTLAAPQELHRDDGARSILTRCEVGDGIVDLGWLMTMMIPEPNT